MRLGYVRLHLVLRGSEHVNNGAPNWCVSVTTSLPVELVHEVTARDDSKAASREAPAAVFRNGPRDTGARRGHLFTCARCIARG